ncbi:CDP-glycerol glycerophosphotransferase family protein [Lacimicrobium alkaliphilum]|uniref:CDP-glycerol--poly(Glycerophosphate) glycerophosphotransferase n=1 Tax=Lacimicrobium alkaliphilum TaxID=1526571 RepID=A0ABQ1RN75_9ALTE|nr:CDP-glycerol glycerophosphotransferase family protein [Lacimicrobium alkaliphilum]GGD72472.1 hypothetical protein GCM10011357_29340 [Lacimicrobium alkaliphilum]
MSQNLETLRDKALYVAPANPAGRALQNRLSNIGARVLGLADNLKQGTDIINDAKQAQPFDAVVVATGAFQNAICLGLLARGFSADSIYCQQENANQIRRFRITFAMQMQRLRNQLVSLVIGAGCWLLPKGKVVYYAEEFIDTNVLLAWYQHFQISADDAVLIAMSLKGQPLDALPGKVLINSPLRAWWHLLRAKVLVLDHEYTGFAFTELRKHKKVIQLWHGLPYKALSGNHHFTEICDQAFVSSSEWFNQHIFPEIFRAREYLSLGYPRCDALLQKPEERVWLNAVPRERLNQLMSDIGPVWIYMPTYRDSGDNSYELDLKTLNAFCQQAGRALVLKFHPFISRKFSDAMDLSADSSELQPLPELPNLYLYPSAMNIYPLLADAEALITDYSSVAFDFLVTDKPIIYYQYDKTRYQAIRGNALVEDKDFIAGPLVQNQQELHQALQKVSDGEDAFSQKRAELVGKFAIRYQPSAPAIANYVASIT